MKILAYGDMHIQSNVPYGLPTETGLTTHLLEILTWFQWLQDVIVSRQPHMVVDLGDFFSAYGSLDVRALNVGVEGARVIQAACKSAMSTYLFVIGNHDIYKGIIHNVPFFPGSVVLSPRVIEAGDINIGFVPYGRSIQEIVNQDLMVVFTHNDYTDIPYHNGHRPEQGDSVGAFKGKLIVNGHYHVPKKHQVTSDLIFLNAGSVGARTFRDCGCVKPGEPIRHGAWMIDIQGGDIDIEFLENPNTSYWLQIDGGDIDAAHILNNSDIADRVNLRVETLGHGAPVNDILAEDRFRTLDIVTLPSVVTPVDEQADADDMVVINPLETTLEYLRLLNSNGDIPELIDYNELYQFVVELVNRVSSESPSLQESIPLRLAKIKLTNFFSLGNVAWDLSPGLSAVIGSNQDASEDDDSRYENNGSGKTSLFEGIFWTMTGKTIRGVSGSGIIREGEKQCSGILTLHIGDRIYTISRTQSRKSKGAHTVEIYLDGENITTRLQDGTHNVINELINIDEDLLMHLVFLMNGLQNSMTRLKPLDRFRLIERLVGDLSIFDACAKAVGNAITTAKSEQDERTGEIRSIVDNKARYNQELQEKQADLQQLSTHIYTRRQELDAMIHQANADIITGNREITRLSTVMESISKEGNNISDGCAQLNQERQAKLKEQSDIYANIKYLTEQRNTQQSLFDAGKCPTCGADTNIADRASVINDLGIEISGKNELKTKIDNDFVLIDSRLTELNVQLRELSNKNSQCNNDIMNWQNTVTQANGIISNAEYELKELDSSEQQAQERVNWLLSELELMDDRTSQAQAVIDALDKRLSMLRFLYHAPAKSGVFSPMGVRSYVINMLLDFLNARCEEYSKYMLPEGQKVTVTSSGSTKGGTPTSKIELKLSGIKRSYASMSAGESRRLDIILHLALRDLAQASSKFNMNFLVLDEVLDPLDSAGIRDVLRLLDTFSGNASVWVVTQSNQLRGELESGILVVKKDGVSAVYPMEN